MLRWNFGELTNCTVCFRCSQLFANGNTGLRMVCSPPSVARTLIQ
jgi:hypothetical protein